jgi:nucleoside-triphosphatase THEP1
MSQGWSESDKKVVKVALERARKRAEEKILKAYRDQKIQCIDDLWALELKIRDWRKEVGTKFYFSYDGIESLLHECLKRGWSELSDLQSLSEERMERVRRG